GPGELLGVVPLGGAGGDEQLRHLLLVHVFLDRRVWRCAQQIEYQQTLVALHQLARLLDRFRRAVAGIIGDEVDLAAVDAARGVYLVESRRFGLADHAVSGRRSAVGHDVADLDFGVGGADIVFLLSKCAAAGYGKQCEGSRKGPQSQIVSRHFDLPGTTMECAFIFGSQHLAAVGGIEYLSAAPGNKTPPERLSRGAVISLMSRANCP